MLWGGWLAPSLVRPFPRTGRKRPKTKRKLTEPTSSSGPPSTVRPSLRACQRSAAASIKGCQVWAPPDPCSSLAVPPSTGPRRDRAIHGGRVGTEVCCLEEAGEIK